MHYYSENIHYLQVIQPQEGCWSVKFCYHITFNSPDHYEKGRSWIGPKTLHRRTVSGTVFLWKLTNRSSLWRYCYFCSKMCLLKLTIHRALFRPMDENRKFRYSISLLGTKNIYWNLLNEIRTTNFASIY